MFKYLKDKTTLVSKHTAKGIDFLDSFGLFIKERAQIEEEYANKLKLVFLEFLIFEKLNFYLRYKIKKKFFLIYSNIAA